MRFAARAPVIGAHYGDELLPRESQVAVDQGRVGRPSTAASSRGLKNRPARRKECKRISLARDAPNKLIKTKPTASPVRSARKSDAKTMHIFRFENFNQPATDAKRAEQKEKHVFKFLSTYQHRTAAHSSLRLSLSRTASADENSRWLQDHDRECISRGPLLPPLIYRPTRPARLIQFRSREYAFGERRTKTLKSWRQRRDCGVMRSERTQKCRTLTTRAGTMDAKRSKNLTEAGATAEPGEAKWKREEQSQWKRNERRGDPERRGTKQRRGENGNNL